MIFCFGGSGMATEVDDDEDVEDSASDSTSLSSSSWARCPLDLGWAVWNRLSDEGSAVGSVALAFPLPFSLWVDGLPYIY